jgi:hypothetical protein
MLLIIAICMMLLLSMSFVDPCCFMPYGNGDLAGPHC